MTHNEDLDLTDDEEKVEDEGRKGGRVGGEDTYIDEEGDEPLSDLEMDLDDEEYL